MPSRYDQFGPFLASQRGERIPLTFHEVEGALGFRLPASKRYPAWWSNNPSNNPMTRVWLDAGFMTEHVNTASEKLVFRRVKPRVPKPMGVPPGAGLRSKGEPGVIARLQAALAGTVKYAPGYDPTQSTGEIWDAER